MANLIEHKSAWKSEFDVPLVETNYEAEIAAYWNRISNAWELLEIARPKQENGEAVDCAVKRL